ncbi:hypothetical protein CRM22_001961 [Opisthorchis felineus]|uniref:Phosphatidylinositol-glycan biosynthesis class F protein n=2 Tax=Opisthorchis felineus TaxID=147828 RepID=A0A4S2ME81_OPIFE|nr:hypothetical protein CRM22_001961 [Opisthorchis felineus]TGZ72648.1 hypothetical protein CRM22_001961 [Opisthorchis felineus]
MKKSKAGISSQLCYLALSVGVYTFLFMLFGAPFLEQHLETVSLAILLTCLTTLPFLALDDPCVRRVNAVYFSPRQPHEWFLAFLGYGAVIGTWSSSALLILDWDRPWQAWPYPCVMGALLGAFFGILLYLTHTYTTNCRRKSALHDPSSSLSHTGNMGVKVCMD